MSSDDASPDDPDNSGTDIADGDVETNTLDAAVIAQQITNTDFDEWYDKYQFAANIRNGTPYFNGPAELKPPGKFSASDLLKCHRKIHYKHQNAPEESADPDGIFFFGTKFEEDLAEQFLEDSVTVPGTFLRNSIWMKSSIETDVGTITLVGSTDPVIVDEAGEPIVLSEIKTSSSIEYTTEPQEHHLAQAHAYLYGMSQKFDREIRDAVFLYAARDTLDVKTFHVTFNEGFWRGRVVDWMKRNTYYRVCGFLPPAEPEHEWECEFCPYKGRCGQTSAPYQDEGAAGFLPLRGYPREKVVEYLEAHEAAQLTPSLAQEYPELVDEYGSYDWECDTCDAVFPWDEVSWDGGDAPPCPECELADRNGQLRGPDPNEQHHIEVVDRPEEES